MKFCYLKVSEGYVKRVPTNNPKTFKIVESIADTYGWDSEKFAIRFAEKMKLSNYEIIYHDISVIDSKV